ncbi:hypothetical protein B0H19DRAFT_1237287 [Mycena capillaripes]|nr:hypothetical protein B0H19DRAFT_1237287 [Mycena capillaripes]
MSGQCALDITGNLRDASEIDFYESKSDAKALPAKSTGCSRTLTSPYDLLRDVPKPPCNIHKSVIVPHSKNASDTAPKPTEDGHLNGITDSCSITNAVAISGKGKMEVREHIQPAGQRIGVRSREKVLEPIHINPVGVEENAGIGRNILRLVDLWALKKNVTGASHCRGSART